jgi:RNA-directed DNA polymerase
VEIAKIDDTLLERAFQAVRKSRRHHCAHASIWHLCQHWSSQRSQILNKLHAGLYHLSPCQTYCIEGERISVWDAADAVVLKAVSFILKEKIQAPHCHHLKGHGGIHGRIKALHQVKDSYHRVFKSDVDSYYASIKHEILLKQLRQYTDCAILLGIFEQYMKRLEIKEGQYHHFEQGIPRGCSLSPLMAAIYLAPLDNELQGFGFYRRYMDDWIMLVKTRSPLRKVIKITHLVLQSLELSMHPKKTFMGCIKKGFAFLGIRWNKVPEIAKQSIENHQVNLARRYAQNVSKNCIGDYLRRWILWCRSVLNCCMDEPHNNNSICLCNTNQGENDGKDINQSCIA